jgi:hypothetical protein
VLGVDAEGRESPVLEGGAWRGAAAASA